MATAMPMRIELEDFFIPRTNDTGLGGRGQ
jgi:hypothetical protein